MFAACATTATAQQVPAASDDPFSEARFRFGVIAVDPRFGVRNVGVDTNVFNSAVNRQRDLTFMVVPGTTLLMRTGKGLLTLDGGLELVYFNQFETERSVNSNVRGQYELRFNRLRPYVSIYSLNTRQRPGYEIDVRARHYETDLHAGTDLRVGSKSTVRVDFRNLDYSFSGDQVFNGRALNQELNRNLKAIDIGWRQRLTALTTWVVRMTRESERFEFENVRNSDSFRVNSGFELGRFALVRGNAFAGYRRLRPADGGEFPEFSGVTADVNVSYTAPTQTRLGAVVQRDIQYSYERRTPYYVQTGWTGVLTQRVVGRWDVQLSGGRDRLSYQAIDVRNQRRDFVGRFGGGVGYTIGDRVRAGFDVQSFYRSSDLREREYGGIRAGFSVTYGY
ncbi:MAG: outer membrane beta-barrel protein [Cyanobacteria bacterium]|nr:outer membrane beta-barrel protein [Cyanobacteriota bacterium]